MSSLVEFFYNNNQYASYFMQEVWISYLLDNVDGRKLLGLDMVQPTIENAQSIREQLCTAQIR